MVEKVMDTPMPESSSKLVELDYTEFLKKDSEHLSCPDCEIIPAIFIEKDSKNCFSISSACENQHFIHNMNIREFFQKSIKKNDYNEKEIITLCQEHNEKYECFCKQCHKNICNKCLSLSHQNHNILKFQDLKPTNEQITKLKDSIKNEMKITSEFFTLEFNRWIEELKDKFEDLMDIISHKNKLYNKIISNYESGNLNYQIIRNMIVIIKDQTYRNPISKELGKLFTINASAKKEGKDGVFNPEKNQHILNILDLENFSYALNAKTPINQTIANVNNNAQVKNNNTNPNNEKSLEDFINNPSKKMENRNNFNNNPNMNMNQNMPRMNLNQIQPNTNFNDMKLMKSQTMAPGQMNHLIDQIEKNNNNNNIPKPKNKNSFYIRKNNDPNIEFQLKGKKVKQNIDLQEFIHSIAKLKAHNSNKFALGLESGAVKIYTFDEKSGDISNFLDFKEHQTALTYVLGLSNGNLLTCSTDKTIKIIGLPKSFFKTYIISQVFQCAPDSFYFQTAIEMTDGNIIAGDWKNIVILQPQKKKGSDDIEYSQLNNIIINNRTTALLQVDEGVFVSAHYGLGIINFFDTVRKNTNTVKSIKCSDESPGCMSIISTGSNGNEFDESNNDKVLLVGGIQCIYFVSIKYRALIYKLFLPDVTYLRTVINTGYNYYGSNILCCGLYNNYSNEIVVYNVVSQGGYNKFKLIESFRISEADKSAINSIILMKKKNATDSSGIVMITGGNEKKLKTYA